jgi:hypothetical protein
MQGILIIDCGWRSGSGEDVSKTIESFGIGSRSSSGLSRLTGCERYDSYCIHSCRQESSAYLSVGKSREIVVESIDRSSRWDTSRIRCTRVRDRGDHKKEIHRDWRLSACLSFRYVSMCDL